MNFRMLAKLLFPPHARCAFCGDEKNLLAAYDICQHCMDRLTKNCENPNNIIAALHYDSFISGIIQRFKYEGQRYLSSTLAQFMVDAVRETGLLSRKIDVVTPVPLHPNKLKHRGYNQSALLAKEFCYYTHLPYLPLLIRITDTQTQTKLSARERLENVKGAFSVCEPVEGKQILLIDDISTTGATIHECKKMLLSAGAKVVFCVCFAQA